MKVQEFWLGRLVSNSRMKNGMLISISRCACSFLYPANIEERIFDQFVSEYKVWYQDCSSLTTKFFETLKQSLIKKTRGIQRSYVINMSRIKDYNDMSDIDELHKRNIIVLCEQNDLKTIKNVLYQIRCNIFHG